MTAQSDCAERLIHPHERPTSPAALPSPGAPQTQLSMVLFPARGHRKAKSGDNFAEVLSSWGGFTSGIVSHCPEVFMRNHPVFP